MPSPFPAASLHRVAYVESDATGRVLLPGQSKQPGTETGASEATSLAHRTPSLLPALPYAAAAATDFRSACHQVLDGVTSKAECTVEKLDDELLRRHWTQAVDEWKRRDALSTYPAAEGIEASFLAPIRMPTAAEEREVFTRDGWRCRWCTTPVIYKSALRRMHLVFPMAFANGYTDASRHGLVLCSRASLDHVVAHSHGGTNADENLVTACWPCQFGRGNELIDRLGISDPRDRKPIVDEWDGVARFRC